VRRLASLYCAACLFAYQTLDNLDGRQVPPPTRPLRASQHRRRQARRTNSSSPLGLLFDHGVDALNTTVVFLVCAGALREMAGTAARWAARRCAMR
jgi:ethanolaminephosphotransferase